MAARDSSSEWLMMERGCLALFFSMVHDGADSTDCTAAQWLKRESVIVALESAKKTVVLFVPCSEGRELVVYFYAF